MNALRKVAALFVRSDSIYKQLPGVDAWDAERNALFWPGGCPVVAHPPCRHWGKLRHFARPEPGEREMALWAVDQVRRWGGVLEHPEGSLLWREACLPIPRQADEWGGRTICVPQFWFGHRGRKNTRLYVVGVDPAREPQVPLRLGEAPCVVSGGRPSRGRLHQKARPEITKREREATPVLFAEWLVALARLAKQ